MQLGGRFISINVIHHLGKFATGIRVDDGEETNGSSATMLNHQSTWMVSDFEET
jgi:hypothetical protein